MNGISHKQAVQWIHRRLDNLLDESQLSSLEEHLHSCEFCRTYAAELDALPAQLQSKFHARWDEPQPSRRVMKYVTTRARKIHISNRISSGATLLAGAMALIVLAVAINFVVSRLQSTSSATNPTDTVDPSPRAEDRLLAFASDQNGNLDVYTIHADGSGLTNLTNHPASDTNPIWSPNGKHIAFESNREGFMQIYLMNADGSGLIQLTKDEADHSLPLNYDGEHNPWSPDGSKLLFIQQDLGAETATLYSIHLNGESRTMLAHGENVFDSISWSPDGNHVAFVLNSSATPQQSFEPDIYIVDSDGNRSRELKSFLPEGETLAFTPYHWSSHGQSIVFTSYTVTNSPLRQTLYEFDLITNTFLEQTETKPDVVDWRDEITLLTDVNQEGMPYMWERSDGTTRVFEESKTWGASCSLNLTRSPGGYFAFGVYCPHTQFDLYWTTPDGSSIEKIFEAPIDVTTGGVGQIVWSPDEKYLAFNLESPGKTDMYIINIEEARAKASVQPVQIPISNSELYLIPSWQPVMMEDLAREESTPQPTSSAGGLLAFTSDQTGDLDIYTMRPDGSEVKNITNHPATDTQPVWSPDGKRLAFQSDRDGFPQIYLMDADGSNVVQLTTDEKHQALMYYMNEFSPWSPDGTKLLISESLPGEDTWRLYIIHANEGRKTLLTDETNTFSALSWSPDGEHVALQSNDPQRGDRSRIFIINADGSDLREVTKSFTPDEPVYTFDYHWSADGGSFFFVALFQNANSSTAYEARLDANSLIEHATTTDLLYGWWNGTYLVNNSSASAPFEWVRPDGTSNKLNPTEECEHIDLYQSDSTVKRSPNGNWVVTGQCANGDTWLYWANSDGTQIQRLLDLPIALMDSFLIPVSWSDDDRFVAFSTNSLSDLGDMYILNVSEALADPSIQPVKLPDSALPSWRPGRDENIVRETPTPQPTSTSVSQGLIAFTSEQNGNSDIYTMRADGSGRTNITNDPAKDDSPRWSPDGRRIFFISERTGNVDIFSMDPDGGDLRQLTDNPGYDGFFSWSPDGRKLMYLSSSGNDANIAQLTLMNADGSNKIHLVSEPGSYIFLGWSPDGQKVVYQKQDLDGIQNNEIHVSDIHGTNHYIWNAIVDEITWEDDQHFVGYGWSGKSEPPTWNLYRFDAAGTPPVEIAVHASRIVGLFQNTYLVEGVNSLSWHSTDGSPTPLKSWDFNAHCQKRGDPFMQDTGHTVSPDGTRAFVTVSCFEGRLWFYLESTDGSDFRQLTDFSVETTSVLERAWSSDGKYVIMTITGRDQTKTDFYLFDIEKMLRDRSTQPIRLTADEALKYEIVWQPTP